MLKQVQHKIQHDIIIHSVVILKFVNCLIRNIINEIASSVAGATSSQRHLVVYHPEIFSP